MKVYGLNKKASKGLWIVYTTTNKHKYFLGGYHSKEKAQEIAEKFEGKYFFNS